MGYNLKRINYILVAFTMILILMTACSGDKNSVNDSSSSGKVQEASVGETKTSGDDNPYAEHLELTWLGYNFFGYVYEQDHPTREIIEEKFNVTLTIPQLDIFNEEQVNLYFAEGQTADYISLTTGLKDTLIDQGVFKSFDLDYARERMPTWFSTLEEFIPYEVIYGGSQYKGEHWGMPWYGYTQFTSWIHNVRADWMENVGITSMPATIDEYEEMLRKFTFEDPDQNGIDDTYGTHSIGVYMYGAYGLPSLNRNPFYVDDNDHIYAVATTENHKELLKKMAEWYDEGLVDPEYITDERAQQRAKWREGKFGVLSDHPWWFAPSTTDDLTTMVKDHNPGAELAVMSPFEGPYGKGTTERAFAPIQYSFYFGRDTSQEKMDRIMDIKEYIHANVDLYERLYFGEEGVHYEVDANGKIEVNPDMSTGQIVARDGIMQFYAMSPGSFDYAMNRILNDDELELYDVALEAEFYPTDRNFVIAGANEALISRGADLTTIIEEFQTQAITGRINIDEEWDKFVSTYMSAGGQEVLDEYQRLYDEFN